jgi:hypothetical protein
MKAEIIPAVGAAPNLVPVVKLIPETKAEVEYLTDLLQLASLNPGKIIRPGEAAVKYQSDLTRLVVAGLMVLPQPGEIVGMVQNLKEFRHESN